MALKKNFKTGSKYNYAFINQMNYIKEQAIYVNIVLQELDSSWKPTKEKIEAGKDEKGNPIYQEFVNDQEPKKRITEMSFTIPFKNPETGEQDELFSLKNISKKDSNLIKNCYIWLKSNVDMFSDWDDC